MEDKRAYVYHYEKKKRKWVFQPLNDKILMRGTSSVMSYPLESWVTEEAVRYVFSIICYSYEGAKEQILRYNNASYQTGPKIYQVMCADSRVCLITKPFLMASLKIRYGDGKDYRVVPDLLSFSLLKEEVTYLLKLNIAFYTIYRHLSSGTTHKETTQSHTTDNECQNKTCP